MTSLISRTPGSTSRGRATSTTSSGRPPRHAITISMVERSMSTCGDAVDDSSTSASTSVSAISLSGIASPPMRSAASCAAANVRFAIQTCSTPRERSVDARPVPICPAPTTSTLAPSNVPRCSAATGDRGRRDRHRDGGRCRSRCAPACPTRPRGGTSPASCGAVPSRTAVCHASRTWPRISLSPTIIESRPAATENRCATAASS